MNKNFDEQKIYGDPKLKLKYEILNKLGQGCFGTIYKAINRSCKRQIALKLEIYQEGSQKRSNMANQILIMQKLKGIHGVPKFYAAGRWNYGFYMEIQLLSSSLHDQRNKQYSQAEIYVMVNELVQILKHIHSRGVVHQDLKPQNIMRNAHGSLCIIDFGLSALYSTENSQTSNKKRGFIGTPRYASLAAHNGQRQSPKDDIQSLLYVIGSLYNKKVPWFQLKCPASRRLQKIQKYKQISANAWFKQCGASFSKAYEYLLELQPKDQVNYEHIINIFQQARKTCVIKPDKLRNMDKENYNRRRSDADQIIKIPTITIHFVDTTNNNQKKVKTMSFKEQSTSIISRSHTNFSQMAQDGYMELLQLLTERIFNTIEDDQQKQQKEDCALVNSVSCKEPQINNIAKYQGLHFKNPFET